ncbi:spore germination protein [Pseudobacteroides cellulosolvens]|uniref:GerA spore germination protein n=1 Tax=Pseudobacteroides cellulosolvens ATCC 35603 = DSM 2933 TaxID=398512 RepID=A0A0L6JT08_9FIRM|nr:spore germination protein [Pseudobacteroides cellulosolvens]KNY28825.1 GerA spore germination protein [Pseudobacteroides cellulosolvens ATCC 35603 = DSM 2933]
MQEIFRGIKNLFSYNESKSNKLDFELLETSNEDAKDESEIPSDNKQNATGEIKKYTLEQREQLKVPLSVSQWNEKNSEKKHAVNPQESQKGMLYSQLSENIQEIKHRFNMPKNKDIIIREFNIARKISACLVFLEGMVDKTVINQFILSQLMDTNNFTDFDGNCPIDYIERNVLSINQVFKTNKFSDIIMQVLSGVSTLLIDGCDECLLIESRGYEKRSVESPKTESVIRGSQEGFTENLRTNITLIRRIIKDSELITETVSIGKRSHTNCAILYIENITNSNLIKEVKRRLSGINIDFIDGDGMVEQLIEDNPFMLFPQVINTERPDRAASFLMEGQVVLITEGSPFAIALPVTFFGLYHTSEDSMVRWPYGTFLRLIRVIGITLSYLFPALYIATTLYHKEMIPTQLLAAIAQSRENVPFPAVVEILMMELAFELIREGGIRVPGVIGQTIGIVGALILGQAAVSAGLISPIMIIIVAVTGLGSFVTPSYSLSLGLRIARFVFTISGALAGFLGVAVALTVIGCIVCNMKSFGVPFFSPIAPKTKANPDIIIRQPLWNQKIRPDYLNQKNRKRQGDNPMGWKNGKGGNGKK